MLVTTVAPRRPVPKRILATRQDRFCPYRSAELRIMLMTVRGRADNKAGVMSQ